MIFVRGWYEDTGLTGTIFEPDENAPTYDGSPNVRSPYVWVCDSFYAVESGGTTQEVDNKEVQVAFDPPVKKGFQNKESAMEGAKNHIRNQFLRLGLKEKEVEFEIEIGKGNSGFQSW